MKKYLLLLALGLLFVQCNSDDSDDPGICENLQKEVDDALRQKLAALEAYTMDPSNPVICANYKEALENRIVKLQDYLANDCTLTPTSVLAAINEDQETIDNLGC